LKKFVYKLNMTSSWKNTLLLATLITFSTAQANFQLPFNGGNLPGFLHNNPFYMNQMSTASSNTPACAEIPGVGLPVLALKKFLIAVDLHLDNTNANTFVKIIFFKETKTATGLNVKLVVAFKTFTDQFYAGIEGELRLRGSQRFRLLSYHYDTDLNSIKEVLGEPNIDVNNFVGCGNLKEIYTNFLNRQKRPEFLQQNIPYGQTALPLTAPTFNNQPPTFAWANGNAPNGSQQNNGPFLYNYGN